MKRADFYQSLEINVAHLIDKAGYAYPGVINDGKTITFTMPSKIVTVNYSRGLVSLSGSITDDTNYHSHFEDNAVILTAEKITTALVTQPR